jgi:hypothetical protein
LNYNQTISDQAKLLWQQQTRKNNGGNEVQSLAAQEGKIRPKDSFNGLLS